jgi:hypothetical protein
MIKKIKRIAFHAQIYDYLWLTKCAEKIKGQLATLEEMYLVVSIFAAVSRNPNMSSIAGGGFKFSLGFLNLLVKIC